MKTLHKNARNKRFVAFKSLLQSSLHVHVSGVADESIPLCSVSLLAGNGDDVTTFRKLPAVAFHVKINEGFWRRYYWRNGKGIRNFPIFQLSINEDSGWTKSPGR